MPRPHQLCPAILEWPQAMALCPQATARAALANLVTGLLLAQSLRPSAPMRALPSPEPVPARQRSRRLQRALERGGLTPAWLTPVLVRAALALAPPARGPAPPDRLTCLVLDTLRCGPWDILTVGVAWRGRVLPISWAVAPAPWPKNAFTPAVCALLRQVAAVWPPERSAHLLADREFPRDALFATLRAAGRGWAVRAQARHRFAVQATVGQARTRVVPDAQVRWRAHAAAHGSGGRAVAGTLVIGRGRVVLPPHQRTAGSPRRRARRLGRRRQHAASRNRGRPARHDRRVILFTTRPTAPLALRSYRRRGAGEGSSRDAQAGWDGRHGRDLRHLARRLPTAAAVGRLVGLGAVGTPLQSWLGDQVEQAPAGREVARIAARWTTTGRLRVWARGQLALTEPSGRLVEWVQAAPGGGTARLRPPARLSGRQLSPPQTRSPAA